MLEGTMPASASRVKAPIQPHDPLEPLAAAIGSVLTLSAGKKTATGSMSFHVSKALHQILEARPPQRRNARMLLIRHLVDIESQ
jgi:hypothetical protein